jgi:hypothetical protein
MDGQAAATARARKVGSAHRPSDCSPQRTRRALRGNANIETRQLGRQRMPVARRLPGNREQIPMRKRPNVQNPGGHAGDCRPQARGPRFRFTHHERRFNLSRDTSHGTPTCRPQISQIQQMTPCGTRIHASTWRPAASHLLLVVSVT